MTVLIALAGVVALLGASLLQGRISDHTTDATDEGGVEIPPPAEFESMAEPEAEGLAVEKPEEGLGLVAADVGIGALGAVCVSAPDCVAWSGRITERALASKMGAEVAGGLLVVTERTAATSPGDVGAVVTAVDVASGEPVWQSTVAVPAEGSVSPTLPTPMRPSLGVTGGWVVTADCRQLTGLGLADGEIVWTVPMPCPFTLHEVVAAPRDDPQVVLAVTSQQTPSAADWLVTAVDVRTATVRWTREAQRAAVTPAGAVVATGDGRLVGLDALTGEARWELTPTMQDPELSSVGDAVLVSDGADRQDTGRLRSATDGAPLLDDKVQRHLVPMIGWTQTNRNAELVTTAEQLIMVEAGQLRWSRPQPATGCCTGSHVA